MKIFETKKEALLTSAGILVGSLMTGVFFVICNRRACRGMYTRDSRHMGSNSVDESEKFHINVAAGASVSIPISAQGDIDISLASDNGDNREKPIRNKSKKPCIMVENDVNNYLLTRIG